MDSVRKNLSNYEPEIDPIPPVEEILNKLNDLRIYFNSARNKVEQSKLSGNGTDDVYKSSWQFFDQLQFLNDNVTPRNTHSNIKKYDKACDDGVPITNNVVSNNRKRPNDDSSSNNEVLLETAINYLKRPKEVLPYNLP